MGSLPFDFNGIELFDVAEVDERPVDGNVVGGGDCLPRSSVLAIGDGGRVSLFGRHRDGSALGKILKRTPLDCHAAHSGERGSRSDCKDFFHNEWF